VADGPEAPKRRVGQRRQLHQRVIYLTQTCDDHGVIEFRQRGIPCPRERSFASLDRGSTPKPVDLKIAAQLRQPDRLGSKRQRLYKLTLILIYCQIWPFSALLWAENQPIVGGGLSPTLTVYELKSTFSL
jgi:hypothetical protein